MTTRTILLGTAHSPNLSGQQTGSLACIIYLCGKARYMYLNHFSNGTGNKLSLSFACDASRLQLFLTQSEAACVYSSGGLLHWKYLMGLFGPSYLKVILKTCSIIFSCRHLQARISGAIFLYHSYSLFCYNMFYKTKRYSQKIISYSFSRNRSYLLRLVRL